MRRSKRLTLTLVLICAGLATLGASIARSGNTASAAACTRSLFGPMVGPFGEKATPFSAVKLSSEDIKKLHAGHYTAAIVWHEFGTDLPRALNRGITTRLNQLGIKVVSVTDAEFDAPKQVNQIESSLAKHPSVMFILPVDPVATVKALRDVVSSGTKIVFMGNVPNGFKYGKDYIGTSASDEILQGLNAANIMAKALNGKGKIGVIYHSAHFFVTNDRDNAFREAIKKCYPNIKIEAEAGFSDPNKVQDIAAGMLTRYSDLNGIYTTWAEPAQGVLAAIREAGRTGDMKLVTIDLSEPLAIDIAKNGPTVGMSMNRIFSIGQGAASMAGLGLLGKKAPAYAISTSMEVTKGNLLQAWKIAYGEPAPKTVRAAMGTK
jgi:ribose transport system substrate-binding protein